MYPITYEADYPQERNRWTTGFRFILVIPWAIVLIVYAVISVVVTVIAWIALVITARYPQWAFDYNAQFVRFAIRVGSWFYLQTDEWPPFTLSEAPEYPVRVHITRAERQSRLKVFFRLILAIPAFFVNSVIGGVAFSAAVVSWLTIVFRGYQPRAAHNAVTWSMTYQARVAAYAGIPTYYLPVGGLLTDAYPPVGEERAGGSDDIPSALTGSPPPQGLPGDAPASLPGDAPVSEPGSTGTGAAEGSQGEMS